MFARGQGARSHLGAADEVLWSKPLSSPRIAWIDYAKAICIILVVQMHCTASWGMITGDPVSIFAVADFARPFRMPAFFVVAGLFLSRSINAPLRDYVDRKIVHFLYFYWLWVVIQVTITETEMWRSAPEYFALRAARWLTFEPYQTLWFIHFLAIFYTVTRVLRRVPPLLLLAGAAALQITFMPDSPTDLWVLDGFSDLYVFFVVGYAGSPIVFKVADWVGQRPLWTLPLLAGWGLLNWLGTEAGWPDVRGASLALALLGAAAVVAISVLLSRARVTRFVRYVGKHSIVIYLTSPLAMRLAEKPLLATGLYDNLNLAATFTTLFAIVAPLAFYELIKNTPLSFLYIRPRWARITHERTHKPNAATPLRANPASAEERVVK